MEERKRHCWECMRRSLVCDSSRPACTRCASSGVECPGYGPVKPVRYKWLAPGKVKCRPRRISRAPPRSSTGSGSGSNSKQLICTPATEPNPALDLQDPEAAVLFQAAEYFNTCIYTNLLPLTELGPNRHIYPISKTHLHGAKSCPDYLQFGMVCMVLSHNMNRMAVHSKPQALLEKFYTYRGMVIRSLNKTLAMPHKRADDMLIAGVLTLLLVDVQHGMPFAGRWHLEGVERLITLRRGLYPQGESKALEPLLVSVFLVGIIGNTTCPASQLCMTEEHMDSLAYILERAATSPIHMCPQPLFAEIVRINHFRKRVNESDRAAVQGFSQEAHEILACILGFQTAEWAATKANGTGARLWKFIGHAYEAAVALYCILSLQSLAVFGPTPALREIRDSLRKQLRATLEEALLFPSVNMCMLWPLVVLGVEAGNDQSQREFVASQLPELSHHVGTYSPLVAKGVLETFWASGKTNWDACFDQPYVLTTQIAVDTSGFLSST